MSKKSKKKVSIKGVDKEELDLLVSSLEGKLTVEALKHYPFEQLVIFRDTGVRQVKTPGGNWPYDRLRSIDPDDWSVSELKEWCSKKIFESPGTRISNIYDTIFKRWKMPRNWNYGQVADFILGGSPPEYSVSGLLMLDFRRDREPVEQLTYHEMCAILVKEIGYAGEHEKVVKELKRVTGIYEDDTLKRLLEHYRKGNYQMSNSVDLIKTVLRNRVALFKEYGDNITDATLGANLADIYNIMRVATKLEYNEFAECWKTALKYVFNHYDEAFSPDRIRRGWPYLQMSAGALEALDGLLVILVSTRDGRTRHIDSKSLNLDYLLRTIISDRERSNLRTFYQEQ